MMNSNAPPIIAPFQRFAVGAFLALCCWPVVANNNLPDDEDDIRIAITQKGVRIGADVLCSIAALESALANEQRSTAVVVETDPDVDTEIYLRILETLRNLGFEQVNVTGVGYPGWALYPPPSDIKFLECDEHMNERTIEPVNDS